MKGAVKKLVPCRSLKVGDRIHDTSGRDAEILEIDLSQSLIVACNVRYEDNNELAWRYYSYVWQQDTLIEQYEVKNP